MHCAVVLGVLLLSPLVLALTAEEKATLHGANKDDFNNNRAPWDGMAEHAQAVSTPEPRPWVVYWMKDLKPGMLYTNWDMEDQRFMRSHLSCKDRRGCILKLYVYVPGDPDNKVDVYLMDQDEYDNKFLKTNAVTAWKHEQDDIIKWHLYVPYNPSRMQLVILNPNHAYNLIDVDVFLDWRVNGCDQRFDSVYTASEESKCYGNGRCQGGGWTKPGTCSCPGWKVETHCKNRECDVRCLAKAGGECNAQGKCVKCNPKYYGEDCGKDHPECGLPLKRRTSRETFLKDEDWCSGHGKCTGGKCKCKPPYTGQTCNQCADGTKKLAVAMPKGRTRDEELFSDFFMCVDCPRAPDGSVCGGPQRGECATSHMEEDDGSKTPFSFCKCKKGFTAGHNCEIYDGDVYKQAVAKFANGDKKGALEDVEKLCADYIPPELRTVFYKLACRARRNLQRNMGFFFTGELQVPSVPLRSKADAEGELTSLQNRMERLRDRQAEVERAENLGSIKTAVGKVLKGLGITQAAAAESAAIQARYGEQVAKELGPLIERLHVELGQLWTKFIPVLDSIMEGMYAFGKDLATLLQTKDEAARDIETATNVAILAGAVAAICLCPAFTGVAAEGFIIGGATATTALGATTVTATVVGAGAEYAANTIGTAVERAEIAFEVNELMGLLNNMREVAAGIEDMASFIAMRGQKLVEDMKKGNDMSGAYRDAFIFSSDVGLFASHFDNMNRLLTSLDEDIMVHQPIYMATLVEKTTLLATLVQENINNIWKRDEALEIQQAFTDSEARLTALAGQTSAKAQFEHEALMLKRMALARETEAAVADLLRHNRMLEEATLKTYPLSVGQATAQELSTAAAQLSEHYNSWRAEHDAVVRRCDSVRHTVCGGDVLGDLRTHGSALIQIDLPPVSSTCAHSVRVLDADVYLEGATLPPPESGSTNKALAAPATGKLKVELQRLGRSDFFSPNFKVMSVVYSKWDTSAPTGTFQPDKDVLPWSKVYGEEYRYKRTAFGTKVRKANKGAPVCLNEKETAIERLKRASKPEGSLPSNDASSDVDEDRDGDTGANTDNDGGANNGNDGGANNDNDGSANSDSEQSDQGTTDKVLVTADTVEDTDDGKLQDSKLQDSNTQQGVTAEAVNSNPDDKPTVVTAEAVDSVNPRASTARSTSSLVRFRSLMQQRLSSTPLNPSVNPANNANANANKPNKGTESALPNVMTMMMNMFKQWLASGSKPKGKPKPIRFKMLTQDAAAKKSTLFRGQTVPEPWKPMQQFCPDQNLATVTSDAKRAVLPSPAGLWRISLPKTGVDLSWARAVVFDFRILYSVDKARCSRDGVERIFFKGQVKPGCDDSMQLQLMDGCSRSELQHRQFASADGVGGVGGGGDLNGRNAMLGGGGGLAMA